MLDTFDPFEGARQAKARWAKLDPVKEELEFTPKKELPEREGPLFNLHKRSLPPGIDKVVEMGLTKAEAITALFGRYKATVKMVGDLEVVTYYDIIAQNASDEEMSIYHNPKAITI